MHLGRIDQCWAVPHHRSGQNHDLLMEVPHHAYDAARQVIGRLFNHMNGCWLALTSSGSVKRGYVAEAGATTRPDRSTKANAGLNRDWRASSACDLVWRCNSSK